MPKIFTFEMPQDRQRYLKAYANTYLQEEVWEEQLIKDLVPFRRFLQVAAQCNGTILNYAKIAADTRVDSKTVQRYFQILEETLVGFLLQPFHRSLRKRQRASPKFYFFDIGIQRALTEDFAIEYGKGSLGYGNRFEHFILCEIVKQNEYQQSGFEISFIRADEKYEIDIVLSKPTGKTVFIEIKSSDNITESHLTSLLHFSQHFPEAELMVWSLDTQQKTFGKVSAFYWEIGFARVFQTAGK